MTEFELINKGICFALIALGFAVLFNIPRRTLWVIALFGALGGLTKTLLVQQGMGLILATFLGSSIIGVLSIQAAHSLHSPHLIFSIPAVIPLVPGIYTYRMMIGLMAFTGDLNQETHSSVFLQAVHNGLTAALITLSLALGIALPMLVTRKNSGKFIRFRN